MLLSLTLLTLYTVVYCEIFCSWNYSLSWTLIYNNIYLLLKINSWIFDLLRTGALQKLDSTNTSSSFVIEFLLLKMNCPTLPGSGTEFNEWWSVVGTTSRHPGQPVRLLSGLSDQKLSFKRGEIMLLKSSVINYCRTLTGHHTLRFVSPGSIWGYW